ncbi:hybrid sensor histidine kinase/response regulator [Aquimarina sediminis]|uniref:hybrid sensor histidine kinase/response regulator n=1 Tax=Aquimarina sediminis TaxID=2070536 RepID=UPI0013E8B4F5|nr:response regulator [Aquimarina sediminis]
MSAQVSYYEVSKDSVVRILEKSLEYSDFSLNPNPQKRLYYLNLAEDYLKGARDPHLKLLANRYKIDFLINTLRDTLAGDLYLKEYISLINQTDDKKELGYYYELLGCSKYIKKIGEGKEEFLKSFELLKRFGDKKDLIDAYYNLSFVGRMEQRREDVIEHSLASLESIKETQTKEGRRVYLNLFLAESYYHLEAYKKAEECFVKVEQDEFFNKENFAFMAFYYGVKAKYYEIIRDNRKSAYYYEIAAYNYYKDNFKQAKVISASFNLANKLKIKEEENKRIKIENELKAEQLKNSRYVILLGIFVVAGLILGSVIQYRNSFYKTKINKILKRNYRKLLKANRKVDKALKAKTEFLDSVTHELLTPLNTIKGTTFLLQKEKLTSHQENQIKLINLSSDYLLGLITNVIQLNDLEKGELELKSEEFNLRVLLNNLINSSAMMNKNNNKIHQEIDHKIPDKLKGDVLKTSQIFLNILDNALKFTTEGEVFINVLLMSLTDQHASIKFSIKDTGIGMSEDQINKAFDTFRQGSVKINRKYGGTGLGLSIVKRILTLQERDIILESNLGEGTSVSFVLDFEIPKSINGGNVGFKNGFNTFEKKIDILLVEDNKVNQLITKKIISNYGFRCDCANDGEEAVDMVKKKKYSMVLMDIMMPKMDGFEATKWIRQFDKEITVVALTAISEKLNKDKFNQVGMFTVLPKPVDPELLYKTILSCYDSNN